MVLQSVHKPWSPKDVATEVARLKEMVAKKDQHQSEFLQAFEEIVDCLIPVFERNPQYIRVMEYLMEPERAIQFRVSWFDELGRLQVNRGFRVQYCSAVGPFKGGLRFHPTVNLSIMKCLGFEQVFKNSLTGLPMGGGKGGSDFDPKGKSDVEIRSFCQAFMTELHRHIGPDTDIPAGDIGVGTREIGYLYGQYKKIKNADVCVFTGKGICWGGSHIRNESTGYGAVYLAEQMIRDYKKVSMAGLRCLLSGSGNAAQYCAEKLIQLKAKVITISDSNGTLHFPNGMTEDQLKYILHIKNEERGRLADFKENDTTGECTYHADKQPWMLFKADLAFPCATQNEIGKEEACSLVQNGVFGVVEVANMPSTNEAVKVYKTNNIIYAPAKAANAGGVAVSCMEMTQNATRCQWPREQVDNELKKVMKYIYDSSRDAAKEYGHADNLHIGANIAAFIKIADSIVEQGLI